MKLESVCSVMSEKRTGCLTAFLVVALLVSAIVNLAFFTGRSGKGVRTAISSSPSSPFGEETVVAAGEGVEEEDGVAAVGVEFAP